MNNSKSLYGVYCIICILANYSSHANNNCICEPPAIVVASRFCCHFATGNRQLFPGKMIGWQRAQREMSDIEGPARNALRKYYFSESQGTRTLCEGMQAKVPKFQSLGTLLPIGYFSLSKNVEILFLEIHSITTKMYLKYILA